MRAHSTLTRRLLASTVPVALLLGSATSLGHADPLIGSILNSYGMPGAIDTPSAEMLPDATLGATVAYSDLTRKNSIIFQALPRLSVALRYSRFDIIRQEGTADQERGHVWDRSFDLRY